MILFIEQYLPKENKAGVKMQLNLIFYHAVLTYNYC